MSKSNNVRKALAAVEQRLTTLMAVRDQLQELLRVSAASTPKQTGATKKGDKKIEVGGL